MRSADRSRRPAPPAPLLALAGALAIASVALPPLVAARTAKHPVGAVTWVRGHGVLVAGNRLNPSGSGGYGGKSVRDLFAGQEIDTTQSSSDVHFYVRLGKKQAYCSTKPSKGSVQVAPPGGGLLKFLAGSSFCGILPTTGGKTMKAPGTTITAQDPVFEVTVTKKGSVVKVRSGALVLSGQGGRKHAVVVTAGSQTTVRPGQQPAQPTKTPPASVTVAEKQDFAKLAAALPKVTDKNPPTVSISGPPDPSPTTDASLVLTTSEAPVTFSCVLDGTDFRVCDAKTVHQGLDPGRHTFLARATDAAGNTGPVATYSWTVERPASSPIAFESNRSGSFQLYGINPDGTGETMIPAGPGQNFDPDWSPDGRQIAFHSDREGNTDIYVMDVAGGPQHRLTTDPAIDRDPTWSPDGKKLAFESYRDNGQTRDIYVMNADGTGQERLTADPGEDFDPHWSPDGTKIAFASDRDGNREIYVMNASDGSNQTRLTFTTATEYNPEWSPDGTKIAFHSDRTQNYDIYVMNADGSNQTDLTQNPGQDFNPTWSPDGSRIAFQSDRDGNNELYVMNAADGSNQTRLTSNPADDLVPDW